MKDQQKYISFIVTFALLLFWLSQKVDSILGIPWLSKIISSGTVALVIYFFYLLWEKVLWKMKFISRFLAFIIGFNVYPVIEGKWKIDYKHICD